MNCAMIDTRQLILKNWKQQQKVLPKVGVFLNEELSPTPNNAPHPSGGKKKDRN